MVIGLLPASGSAKRLGGLPKFGLPINETMSLIEQHVFMMQDFCDEIRISTRLEWIPILRNMNLYHAEIHEHEPSTMLDAVNKLASLGGDDFVVGMPDTFFLNYDKNPYKELIDIDSEIGLALWECTEDLRGKVGQVRTENLGRVVEVIDKDLLCSFPNMWGIFKFNSKHFINPLLDNPSLQFQDWIHEGYFVGSCKIQGSYIDAGSLSGVTKLYRSIGP